MSVEKQKSRNWSIVFLIFGIVATLCGIYLIFLGDYLIGVSGTISSAAVVAMVYKNMKKETEV